MYQLVPYLDVGDILNVFPICLSAYLPNPVPPLAIKQNAVHDIWDALAKVAVIDSSQTAIINKLGLLNLVSDEEKKKNVETVVSKWITLEEDPEIIASDDLLLNSEVEQSLDSAEASFNISQFDVIDHDPDDYYNVEQRNMCEKLLKSCEEAIDLRLSDPILSDLVVKLRERILEMQLYLHIVYYKYTKLFT